MPEEKQTEKGMTPTMSDFSKIVMRLAKEAGFHEAATTVEKKVQKKRTERTAKTT